MITIEEYIARRKKEDGLKESNIENRIETIRIIVNYVFEYFNNYINITAAEERTALHDEKIDKYRQYIQEYDLEVIEWLVRNYGEHGSRLDRNIGRLLKEYDFFLLYNEDSEFRNVSYDCYSKLIKKLPFLNNQTEMLFLFIKDRHRVLSQRSMKFDSLPVISDSITEWIETTWTKHQVSIVAFVERWVSYFLDNESLWPATHRKKSIDPGVKYEYDFRQKNNLFNIDSLYRKIPKKTYTKGKKQEFEILMMYYWLHNAEGDSGYWQEYIEKTLS
ncbi:MAG: hypothetical protein M1489_06050 [Firmicutes bacterium]|nr:hypothetical protein [Bacillota bacterium]